MNKVELDDLILQHLYEMKEKDPDSSCANIDFLTERLNEQNNGLSVTKQQVDKTIKYLLERKYVKGFESLGGFLDFSITGLGEYLVDSGYSVLEARRSIFKSSQVNVTNTTINGNVNQFVQGNNNELIQNNRVETADDLFEKLIELLKQHGETNLADEAEAEKKSGGIHKALAFVTKKITDSFSTKTGQELVPLVMPAIAEIMEAPLAP